MEPEKHITTPKYELTTNSIHHFGRTLYQIRALRDIKEIGIKADDLGGWIEKVENLSQDGNAWVSDDACVFDDACVSGEARVSGNARVFGEARVHKQYDHITVTNLGSRNATTTFMRVKQGGIFVTCGCWSGMIDAFAERVKQVHGDSAHGKAYQSAIQMALTVINQEPAPEKE